MTTLSFHDIPDQSEVQRYSLSASVVVFIHVLLICAMVFWYTPSNIEGTGAPSIMVDLQTVAPTPDAKKLELPPDELMREAPAPLPEPEKQVVEKKEDIAPAPIQEKPVVTLPPEQKEKPKPLKDKVPVVEKKPPVESVAAPRTSAPAMASQAARASYNGMVASHLRRFKTSGTAGLQGTVSVIFTLGRRGNLIGARLAESSGSSALDSEALAMVRRANPYPPFLPDMQESAITFDQRVNFAGR